MKYVCLFAFLLGAVGYDIDCRRIPNIWCLTGIFSGAVISLSQGGIRGLAFSLLGIFLPVIILFMLFVWRVLGAGDIKLFAAIGAYVWLDIRFVVLYAFVLTAVYGVVVLCARRIRRRPYQWTRICMSIPIAIGTMLFVVGGRFH